MNYYYYYLVNNYLCIYFYRQMELDVIKFGQEYKKTKTENFGENKFSLLKCNSSVKLKIKKETFYISLNL